VTYRRAARALVAAAQGTGSGSAGETIDLPMMREDVNAMLRFISNNSRCSWGREPWVTVICRLTSPKAASAEVIDESIDVEYRMHT